MRRLVPAAIEHAIGPSVPEPAQTAAPVTTSAPEAKVFTADSTAPPVSPALYREYVWKPFCPNPTNPEVTAAAPVTGKRWGSGPKVSRFNLPTAPLIKEARSEACPTGLFFF